MTVQKSKTKVNGACGRFEPCPCGSGDCCLCGKQASAHEAAVMKPCANCSLPFDGKGDECSSCSPSADEEVRDG